MSVWSHRKGDRERREAAGDGAGAEQLLQDLSAPLGMGKLALDCRERGERREQQQGPENKEGHLLGQAHGETGAVSAEEGGLAWTPAESLTPAFSCLKVLAKWGQ